MLNSLLSRLYTALVTAAMTLMAFCFVDQKFSDASMFPYPNPNGWTWSLWITIGLALAPWVFAGVVLATGWVLERTIGIPSEQPAHAPVRGVRKDHRY